ncbi:NEW3 domain-containing protein [Jiangella alkaliphila]|uniref:F5/8 type C domain-containing protein n=1 Tax=Jiangella alkaliphila TaxID=419479 RepID=A0A1H2JLV1_9ACTN|nr:NEW3 domain-containing protein [Jiangella alkaliphila]SDU57430.1 F5/8 type C domain-containing protein [Jiangella alkaliphila]
MTSHRRFAGLAAALSTVALALVPVAPGAATAAPAADAVTPVDWSRFDAGLPDDAQAERVRAILLNSSEYTLRTWFPARYGGQTSEYLDLGGVGEGNVRPPGSAALGLATVLATGAYDPAATGVPEERAREVALRLITSIAYRHESNSTAGAWGTEWQSALWAFNAAFAGWLLWDDLPDADRERLARMVRAEAGVFLDYTVPYYQRPDGTVVTPGDSKAEENAWNAAFLNLAVAMMPEHPDVAVWQDKALELMVSAYSRPSDLHDDTVVNGKPLSEWLNGSNIFEDGTLVNHSRIHPDYFTSIANSVGAPLAYALAGRDTPRAALHNAGVVYEALADHVFAAPPYAAPGGTIYVRDAAGAATARVYYPQGNDWGTDRQLHFLLLDTLAASYGFDAGSELPAAGWAAAHAQRALDMQARFDDGRTYGAASEDTYSGREQWVALLAARTYLTHWLGHNTDVGFTNQAFPVRPGDRPGATLTLDAAAAYPQGVATPVTVAVRSTSAAPLNRLVVGLELPDGWQATRTGTADGVLPPGGTATVTWQVTPPDDAGGTAELAVTARYRHYGTERELTDSAAVAVPPGVNVAVGRPVTVSSALRANTGGGLAVDGGFADASRWLSAEGDPAPWLVVDLGEPADVAEIHVYSGYNSTNHDPTTTLKDFAVEVRTPAGWQQVAAFTGNVAHHVVAGDVGVTGDQVRLSITDPSGSSIDVARVFEVEVYSS